MEKAPLACGQPARPTHCPIHSVVFIDYFLRECLFLDAQGSVVANKNLLPFWSTVLADVARFQETDPGMRGLVRGLLSQGFFAIFTYRMFRWFYERNIPTQPIRFVVERIIEITTGISIPAQAKIGKGLRIHHFGGIFIHSEAVLGDGCTIYQGVTLGDLGGWGGTPSVGNDVLLGAGAKVLGNITVGDHVRIGANAVVLQSIPSGHLAVGVPAVVKNSVGVLR